MSEQPIRVFYSTLTDRFYASSRYRIDEKGFAVTTGKKYDVTDDIAHAIVTHNLEFTRIEEGAP